MKINSQYSFLLVQQQYHPFVLQFRIPQRPKVYCLSASSVQCKLEIGFMLSGNSPETTLSLFLYTPTFSHQLNFLFTYISASRSTTWYILKGFHYSTLLVFHSNQRSIQTIDSFRLTLCFPAGLPHSSDQSPLFVQGKVIKLELRTDQYQTVSHSVRNTSDSELFWETAKGTPLANGNISKSSRKIKS